MWTELKNLKESNEFLNLLLDNINSAVLIADENLQIHQFNDSFLDLVDKATQSVDKILLYTDGLIENRNSAGAYFGKQRFYDLVKKHGNESVRKIVETVYATAKEFRQQAKPEDDVSILGVEYCG